MFFFVFRTMDPISKEPSLNFFYDLASPEEPCSACMDAASVNQPSSSKVKSTVKRRERKQQPYIQSKSNNNASSYVISKEAGKGRRLIKIEIIDTTGSPQNDKDAEEGVIIVSAQYNVKEAMDDIMDQTETLVHNISKKLCGYSFYVF